MATANNSMDVRARAATLYERRSLSLKLRVAVSPHVNSAVRRFMMQ